MDPQAIGDPRKKLDGVKKYLTTQTPEKRDVYIRIYGDISVGAIEMLARDGDTVSGLRKKYPIIFQELEKVPRHRNRIKSMEEGFV